MFFTRIWCHGCRNACFYKNLVPRLPQPLLYKNLEPRLPQPWFLQEFGATASEPCNIAKIAQKTCNVHFFVRVAAARPSLNQSVRRRRRWLYHASTSTSEHKCAVSLCATALPRPRLCVLACCASMGPRRPRLPLSLVDSAARPSRRGHRRRGDCNGRRGGKWGCGWRLRLRASRRPPRCGCGYGKWGCGADAATPLAARD